MELTLKPSTGWKRQMVVIWISQWLSIMGFSFAFPFVPFFLQADLGIVGEDNIAFWVSMFAFSTAVSMGLAAPFWGALADRFGRRIMLIRATLCGAACMSLMGGVRSAGVLIFLRTVQGALTGTMTAAQAFVSGEVPPERRGLAIGGLSAAVFSGSMSGSFVGGFVADRIGYRAAFYCSGLLLLVSGLLIVFATRETAFVPTPRQPKKSAEPPATPIWRSLTPSIWIALGLIALLSFIRQQDMPFIPLLVQKILGSLDEASLWTGWVNATGSVAGLLAGLLAGWMADRLSPRRILLTAAALAIGFASAQGVVGSFATLFPIRFMTVFVVGFIEPTLNAILAKQTPESCQGRVFGWASTTRSIGWALGPLLAGWLVADQGLSSVFFAAGIGYALLFLLLLVLPIARARKNGLAM